MGTRLGNIIMLAQFPGPPPLAFAECTNEVPVE